VAIFATYWQPTEAASTLEPIFSLPGGYYDRDIQLEISAPNSANDQPSDVIFTVDGSVPTYTVGTIYTHSIHLSAAMPAVTVIRARAVLPDAQLGPVVSASYFVGVSATLPMISLIVDPGDLWDPERGICANPYERGDAWERPVDITYVDEDRRSGFHIPAGVRIHGQGSRAIEKKSLRLYFRQKYGDELEYPLFSDSKVESFERLVLHNGGQDSPMPNMNCTLIRNQLADSLAFQLDGYATHSQPALVFVNGELWGIYQIRERIDRHFLADHYDIDEVDFLNSPEHVVEQAIILGERENWDYLLQFVETHDLVDSANYAYVQSQVDIANFIDYNLIQIYAANTDWPRRNVHQFRPRVQGGRWHWMFWDSDSGFGAYSAAPWRQSGPNLIKYLLDYDHPDTGGQDVLLLRKLLENPTFLDRFISRAADLLNTTFAPRSVIAQIDALAAELEPDIAYETFHWPDSVGWESSVQELRDFALERPDLVRQYIVEAFGLDGTAQLTFNPPTSGSGSIAVNGALLQNLPWQGIYFQGIPIQAVAVPTPGYRFAGWDPPELAQIPMITLTVNAAQTLTPRFELVGDNMPCPGDMVFGEYHYHTDDDNHIQGDWFELRVMRPGGVDLRGWRVTDNDTKTATDEGSLIFTDHPAFAHVPRGTIIRIIAPPSPASLLAQGKDDLNTWDQQMVLYAGGSNLDITTDPGFNLNSNDNIVLLAPGPTDDFNDDQGIAFVTENTAVTPASFGVLADGVWPTPLGDDY
jgi:hypothetical protein